MNDSLMAVSASSAVPYFRDGRLRGDRQRGVSMVELVVAVPALLLVGMAVVQMVLVFHARQSVGYALHHVGGWTTVSRYKQRVFAPCTQIVQRERVAVFRRQLRVTRRYYSGVARVPERVELSSPWSAQPSGVVEL